MNRGPRRTSAGSIDGGASLVWIGIVVLAVLGAALPLELPRPRASTFDETLSGRAPFAPVGLAGKSMVNSWLNAAWIDRDGAHFQGAAGFTELF